MPPPRRGSVPSPFSLAYTLGCRVSLSSEAPVTALAAAGQPGALAYTYHFTIDARVLHTVASVAALLLLLLAVLSRLTWRAVRRRARTGLARAATAGAVAAVLGWGVANFVWRDVAVPAATLLLAGRAGARSVARYCIAAAPAWWRRVRVYVAAGWRTVVEVFEAVVVATVVLALTSSVAWVLRWFVVVLFSRGDGMQSPGLTMADYDNIVRMTKARWERPITDWTWANGYVTRPCRFPQCVLPEDD